MPQNGQSGTISPPPPLQAFNRNAAITPTIIIENFTITSLSQNCA
jgi:hypothetical protein